MKPLSIAFYGSSLVSAYWNGAATYYRGIVRGLARLGHAITFFEPDAFERQAHRDIDDPPWAKVVVYPATAEGLSRALDRSRDFDVVIKASGVGVFDAELEREVIARRRAGQQVFFWDVDAPATLDRLHGDANEPFRALVPQFDLVFTYGGGPPVQRAYLALGAKDCVPVYNAVDPDVHFPVIPDPRFASDFAFLGNRLPDREARVEDLFFGVARALPEKRFLLGGSGWEPHRLPSNVRHVGHVFTRDHNAFNCTPSAVLNIARESMARYGWSPATRVFEAAGAAACMVTDAWEGLSDFLEPDREVIVASNREEVVAHVAALTPSRARALGLAAQRRVLAHHTYAHRAALVQRILDGHAVTRPMTTLEVSP